PLGRASTTDALAKRISLIRIRRPSEVNTVFAAKLTAGTLPSAGFVIRTRVPSSVTAVSALKFSGKETLDKQSERAVRLELTTFLICRAVELIAPRTCSDR